MRLALDLAAKALECGEPPIGAVVAFRGRVVASAYCHGRRDRKLAHAELNALVAIDERQFAATDRREMALYSTLEPCVMCLGAAMALGVGRVVYGADAPADGAVTRIAGAAFGGSSLPDYRMPAITPGILRDECIALFDALATRSRDKALADFARGIVFRSFGA